MTPPLFATVVGITLGCVSVLVLCFAALIVTEVIKAWRDR